MAAGVEWMWVVWLIGSFGGLVAGLPAMAPPKEANINKQTTLHSIQQRQLKESAVWLGGSFFSMNANEWKEMERKSIKQAAHQRPPAGGKGSNHKPTFLSPAAREEKWLVGWLLGLLFFIEWAGYGRAPPLCRRETSLHQLCWLHSVLFAPLIQLPRRSQATPNPINYFSF